VRLRTVNLMTRAFLTGLVVAVALTLNAGCNRETGHRSSVADGADVAVVDASSCALSVVSPGASAAASARPRPQALPEQFTAVEVRRCVERTEVEPGDGEWLLREEQVATSGLGPLLRALRQPSSPVGDICTAEGHTPIELTLVDAAGATVVPAVPYGGCGAPQPAVVQAIAALPWKTVTSTKVAHTRSQLELDSGCPGAYKPVVAIAAVEPPAPGATPVPMFGRNPASNLVVCRYTADPADLIGMSSGPPLQVGHLASASGLTDDALARLSAALGGAPPARAGCDAAQAPFALVQTKPNVVPTNDAPGFDLAIELGGCDRALTVDGRLLQLDAVTVAALRG
jgi:hypothetical protein